MEIILSNFTHKVLNRLGPIALEELSMVIMAIDGLKDKGWTISETALYLKWLEHVDPTVDEEVALRNMAEIRNKVNARLTR